MNTAKMRSQLERTRVAAADHAYRARLAAMTPEHRAIHEKAGLCGECITAAFSDFGRRLGVSAKAMNRDTPS